MLEMSRPLLLHASRSFLANVVRKTSSTSTKRSFSILLDSAAKTSAICLQCQFRASARQLEKEGQQGRLAQPWPPKSYRQTFSLSRSYADDKKPSPPKPVDEVRPLPSEAPSQDTDLSSSQFASPPAADLPPAPPATPLRPASQEGSPQVDPLPQSSPARPESSRTTDDTIKRVPDEELPSYWEKQRWALSKRFNEWMDDVLPKLAILTHKVNTYTGTDYSGIEGLRREIKEQEKLVKARRLAVEEAKQALDAARTQQASSQKEVVGLLERKHSWSAADLERYMSLIRSEHLNDQAVNDAKENVNAAEKSLEDARVQLEKRERSQYHEEQIWSDTIRRNSTWVTFGLMGLNIFLLLLSTFIIEPWRRRRMVREFRRAIDEQKPVAAPATAQHALPLQTVEPVEGFSDAGTESAIASSDSRQTMEPTESPADAGAAQPVLGQMSQEPVPERVQELAEGSPGESIPDLVTDETPITDPEAIIQETEEAAETLPQEQPSKHLLEQWLSSMAAWFRDPLSNERVSIRKIDVTSVALQSAALGAVLSAIAIALIESI